MCECIGITTRWGQREKNLRDFQRVVTNPMQRHSHKICSDKDTHVQRENWSLEKRRQWEQEGHLCAKHMIYKPQRGQGTAYRSQ